MAIELLDEIVSRCDKIGDDDFDLSAGKSLKIETSPRGEDVLDVTVPSGKKWHVHVAVVIQEVDA